ncbi:MAG: L,D-transpeptidase [Candidatus Shapirobacteria bacterium]|jgi:lipoprotein-anchoring transpeptidase ErfK/SrfK
MKKLKLPVLLSLFSFLSFCLALFFLFPQLFYYQNPINPGALTEDYQSVHQPAYFQNHLVSVPKTFPGALSVLGDNNPTNKRIEVDLSTQRLKAFEDNNQIFDFVISSGKYDRTPNGIFKIWTKIRSQKMSGGSKAAGTYYYLPNVPYIMFFYNAKYAKAVGFSLHGTYWHNNFGVPMSHGCVNMKTPEAAQLFGWAEINTPVIIYGKYQPPKS